MKPADKTAGFLSNFFVHLRRGTGYLSRGVPLHIIL